ncbi:hypothetical protein AB20_3379 [Escherichia coli 3-475-03_S1_C1]|nr:hypothetical protein AB20_3379 [Escherichia coli 3-475-03_S1_C1]
MICLQNDVRYCYGAQDIRGDGLKGISALFCIVSAPLFLQKLSMVMIR